MRLEASRFLSETYLEFHGENSITGNVGTSKRLFSKFPARPTTAALAAFLKQTPVTAHDGQLRSLQNNIVDSLFPQWQQQLESGCNLAWFGYGSKTALIDQFLALPFFDTWHIFCMRAYAKAASFLELLQKISGQLSGTIRQVRRVSALASDICQQLKGYDEWILLVVEMADAPCMRSPEVWRALVAMAQFPKIRLILTFEHVNALLLNSHQIWSSLNLAWHDATTLRPYSAELGCILAQRDGCGDGDSKWKGAKFVLASLTPAARNVFGVLAEQQLGQANPSSPAATSSDADDDDDVGRQAGLGFVVWYQRCQERFFVSNELAFRTQLTEFLDHELVCAVDDAGQNGTAFYIPFDRTQIEALLEICKAN